MQNANQTAKQNTTIIDNLTRKPAGVSRCRSWVIRGEPMPRGPRALPPLSRTRLVLLSHRIFGPSILPTRIIIIYHSSLPACAMRS